MTTAARVFYSSAYEDEPWMPTGGNPACAYERTLAQRVLPGTGAQAAAAGFVFQQGLIYPLLIHVPESYPAGQPGGWSPAVLNVAMPLVQHVVVLPETHIEFSGVAGHQVDAGAEAPSTVTAQEQIDAVQDALSLGISHIAEILGVGRDTVHRWARGDTPVPRDPAVARRLRGLVQIADAWVQRSVHVLGALVTAPLGESQPSLYDLLREPVWEHDRIQRALETLAAHGTARHERVPQPAPPSSPVAVERQQLRQVVQRGRYHRR